MTPIDPVIVTIQELKIAKKILEILEYKREKYGDDYAWIYLNDIIRSLHEIKSRSIRSFIDKLERLGVIEYLPVYREDEEKGYEWSGGLFRFTPNGIEKINKELDEILFKNA